MVISLGYNTPMTTINTMEDLARILQEQPTWAEALRALLLTRELLELPERFDRFVQSQQAFNEAQSETNRAQLEFNEDQRQTNRAQLEFNEDQRQTNRAQLKFNEEQRETNRAQLKFNDEQRETNQSLLEFKEYQEETNRGFIQRFDNIEGRLGNLEGAQYERTVRTKALARTQIVLGFEGARVALNQEGLVDPQLNSSVARAVRDGHVTLDGYTDLFEADIIISARDNQHAVVEVSITADTNDIDRANSRAGILTAVTGGTVTPVVITARLDPVQSEQAEAVGVRVFVVAYP